MSPSAVLLLAFCFVGYGSMLYYHQGETFSWNDYTVDLSPKNCNFSNTTNIPPYLVVEDQGPFAMNMSYNMTANMSWSAWVRVQSTNFRELRLDSGRTLSFTLSTNSSMSNPSYTALMPVYMATAADGTQTYSVLSLAFQCKIYGCSSSKAIPNITFGGLLLEVVPGAPLPSLKPHTQSASTTNFTVDVMSVSSWLVAQGHLNPFDSLIGILVGTMVWSAGTFGLSMSQTSLGRWDYYRNSTITVGGLAVVHEAVLSAVATLDYSNTSMAANPQTIGEVVYDFEFLTSVNTQSLKVHPLVNPGLQPRCGWLLRGSLGHSRQPIQPPGRY